MARGQRVWRVVLPYTPVPSHENSGTHRAGTEFYFGVVGADGLEPPTYAL